MAKKVKKVKIDESRRVQRGDLSVTIKAQPLELELAPSLERPAQAAAKVIAAGIRNVNREASAGTVRQRKAKGITSTRKWNATGKLASSIAAEKSGGAYVVTAGGDRLEQDELAEQLAGDVPAIGGDSPELERAIDDALEEVVDEMIEVVR